MLKLLEFKCLHPFLLKCKTGSQVLLYTTYGTISAVSVSLPYIYEHKIQNTSGTAKMMTYRQAKLRENLNFLT